MSPFETRTAALSVTGLAQAQQRSIGRARLTAVLFRYFPPLMIGLLVVASVRFIRDPGLATGAFWLFVAYAFPILIFRTLQLFYPIQYGKFALRESVGGSSWNISFKIQMIYGLFPVLEAALRVVPGAYSAWLRLWGSKIGSSVVWVPNVKILDRASIDVGDHCMFGSLAQLTSHLVKPRGAIRGPQTDVDVFVKPVRIGKACFIGAESTLLPGTILEDGTRVEGQVLWAGKGELRRLRRSVP